jgi:hypothetical protein
MIPHPVIWIAIALYPVSEIALAFLKRSKAATAKSHDHGSGGWIWIMVTLGVVAAIAAQRIPFTQLNWPDRIVRPVVLALMLADYYARPVLHD